MVTSIKEIKAIGSDNAERLAAVGIRTTAQLLEVGATSTGRMRIADETHIAEEDILMWVHRADIMRVNNITEELAQLLCGVDVCTLPKLAFRRADTLHLALTEYASEHRALKHVPTVKDLEKIISKAKIMPKTVRH